MAKISTSVEVILIVWYSIFFNRLLKEWTWAMEVVTLFLILTLEITMTIDGLEDVVSTILLEWLQ